MISFQLNITNRYEDRRAPPDPACCRRPGGRRHGRRGLDRHGAIRRLENPGVAGAAPRRTAFHQGPPPPAANAARAVPRRTRHNDAAGFAPGIGTRRRLPQGSQRHRADRRHAVLHGCAHLGHDRRVPDAEPGHPHRPELRLPARNPGGSLRRTDRPRHLPHRHSRRGLDPDLRGNPARPQRRGVPYHPPTAHEAKAQDPGASGLSMDRAAARQPAACAICAA